VDRPSHRGRGGYEGQGRDAVVGWGLGQCNGGAGPSDDASLPCGRARLCVSSEARWATCQRPARTGTSCTAGVCVSAKARLATCRRSLPSPSPVKQRRRNPAALIDDGLDCALVDGGLDCARVPVIVLYRWPFMCLACAADMSSSVPPLCPELAPRFERTSFLSKQRLQSGAR
jgi:hypothetical protein